MKQKMKLCCLIRKMEVCHFPSLSKRIPYGFREMQMATLFGVTPQNITIHLRKVYESNELTREATRKDFLLVQKEGTRLISRVVTCYNQMRLQQLDQTIEVMRQIPYGFRKSRWLNYLVKTER